MKTSSATRCGYSTRVFGTYYILHCAFFVFSLSCTVRNGKAVKQEHESVVTKNREVNAIVS